MSNPTAAITSALATLGTVAISAEDLTLLVANTLGAPEGRTTVSSCTVDEVDYALATITTRARYWVSGRAETPAGEQPFRMFLKIVQSFDQSPLFATVPDHLREQAAASVPWRIEPLVYESDLAAHLPQGLRMLRALAVRWPDDRCAAIWLPVVTVRPQPWGLPDYRRAGRLIGRFAAAPGIRQLAQSLPDQPPASPRPSARAYAEGRLGFAVAPALGGDSLWEQPVVAQAFPPALREDLQRHLANVPRYVEELESFPQLAAHGDACPNNLLLTDEPGVITLIDFGTFSEQPLGFDLSQMVLGEIHLGREDAAALPALEAAAVEGYVAGLADAGLAIDAGQVRRAHALKLLLFSGLPAPFDLVFMAAQEGADRDSIHHGPPQQTYAAAQRAAVARHAVDLVDSTA